MICESCMLDADTETETGEPIAHVKCAAYEIDKTHCDCQHRNRVKHAEENK